jgi:hypothetical protein
VRQLVLVVGDERVDGDDAGVLDQPVEPRLGDEQLGALARARHLHRHLTVEGRLVDEQHRAHAALAEQPAHRELAGVFRGGAPVQLRRQPAWIARVRGHRL